MKDIDTQNSLLAMPRRSAAQENELREASERLEAFGVTRSHPNPLFDLFAKAVAEHPLFQKPLLSKKEIAEQETLAHEILDGILRGPQ